MLKDLNKLEITADTCTEPLTNNSAASSDGSVRVHFRDLEKALIANIRKARLVVGCVAWLTSEPLLNALASVSSGVSIVVQKEDFLRPDLNTNSDWALWLQSLYSNLRCKITRGEFPGITRELSFSTSNLQMDAVRCVGNHNREKKVAFPRMHNKFIIFCDIKKEIVVGEDGCHSNIVPYAVWTGSFNFSKTAKFSFENAVVLTDKSIVQAYFNEWGQINALSEPLDWTDPWCSPEWRIGS
jgi:hypothetical protein